MKLEQIVDANEQILWTGKPNRFLFTLGSIWFYLFAIGWGAFDFILFKNVFHSGFANDAPGRNGLKLLPIIFILVHLIPVWIAIFGPIYRFFLSFRIEYMITNRRVYLSSGIMGTDITSVEFRDVTTPHVNVNPLQNMLKVGTIRVTPDVTRGFGDDKTTIKGYRLEHISEPYEVFNLLKRLSTDVTTDQMYPNAYRPQENPGYNTQTNQDYWNRK